MVEEAAKLTRTRSVNRPAGLFDGVPSRMLLAYRRRVGAEGLRELRRHPDPIRVTLLAAFCHVRGREIADTLAELLITTVHRVEPSRANGCAVSLGSPDIGIKAEKRVEGERTLRDLVAKGGNTGPIYRSHLQTVIHNSYRSHYRRMLPLVLDALIFQCNNQAQRPVLDAPGVIARRAAHKMRCCSFEEAVQRWKCRAKPPKTMNAARA